MHCIGILLYRKNFSMKEKLNEKGKHKLYTQLILVEKQISSSTIAYLLIYSASNIIYIPYLT